MNVDDKVSCRMSYEDDDLSFNSKSFDSSNLSIKLENISATSHDESSSNDRV